MKPLNHYRRETAKGFTLVEVLVAMALGMIVIAAAMSLFSDAANATFTVTQRSEMQQNARAAINNIAYDLRTAGTGMPQGGVTLPTGTSIPATKFGCDATTCYVTNNTFPGQVLYAVTSNTGGGPTVTGRSSDSITISYVDSSAQKTWCFDGSSTATVSLNSYNVASITKTGTTMVIVPDPKLVCLVTDAVVGVQVGDIIMLSNANGNALGLVTAVNTTTGAITFADGDVLKINQTTATAGNIIYALSNAGTPGTYPPTSMLRLMINTYFVQVPVGPSGVVGGSDSGQPRLMRQVNITTPSPVAEGIEDIQFTYDIFDDTAGAATNNLTTGILLNQVRKVNIYVYARSPYLGPLRNTLYHRQLLVSAITPRNLSFRDRYQ
jgi:prepilin-type N-terminal cleavage/methylation domain-containing protein